MGSTMCPMPPEHPHANHIDYRTMDRRSVIALPVLLALASIKGCCLGVLDQASPHPDKHNPLAKRPRTKEELIAVLRSVGGYEMKIAEEAYVEPQEEHPTGTPLPESAQQIPPPAEDALDVRLSSVRERVACASSQEWEAAWDWMRNYRASEEQAACIPPDSIDCNDHCNIHCHRLSYDHRLPMHLVAYWPSDAAKTGKDSWHIVAVCKLGPQEFLILDNGSLATFWHGTLGQYGQSYPSRFPSWGSMDVMPAVGIARYVRPKYDTPFAKGALQVLLSCDEADMETLALADAKREELLAWHRQHQNGGTPEDPAVKP